MFNYLSIDYKWHHCTFFQASSVDAERAFSDGRLEVNDLQHNTSSQTFKAQMAVGSWAASPLFPGLSEVTKIVEKHMAKGHDNDLDSDGGSELDVELALADTED